jgi:hypothetical protein
MKRLSLAIGGMLTLFSLTMLPAYAQNLQQRADFEEAEAVFDDDSAATEEMTAHHGMSLQDIKQKFNLKLYLDVMYEESLGDSEEYAFRETEAPSFSTNHTYLMLQASPTDKLRVGFDIQFDYFYEIEYFPAPTLSFKAGKIFLPFGDFNYHPIYGGKVYSLDNDLFPNWLTDYGIAFGHRLLDTDRVSLNYELFVSNGFQEYSAGYLDMNVIGFDSDNNSEKAFGGRMKTTWFGRYNVTASGMLDHWSDDGEATLGLWALDFSTNDGLADLPILSHVDLKLGYLNKHVENDNASNAVLRDYDGFGSHIELSTKPVDWLKIAFRMGEVDPNENIRDQMDQRNYNVHGIFYLEECLELWAIYQQNQEKYVDEIDNDYLALKVVLNY